MQRLESEASRMGLLVEDLLQLARLDQQRPPETRPVDLLSLAADAVQDARLVAPDRTIDLSVAPGAAFLVDGDEQRLRQVIGNLVNNALTHTPAGTSVRVAIASGTLKSSEPAVVLDVIDDGPGMTADQAQRVFERFYRADAARNPPPATPAWAWRSWRAWWPRTVARFRSRPPPARAPTSASSYPSPPTPCRATTRPPTTCPPMPVRPATR